MQSAEKEDFRNYLEKSGVIDALTKVLVGLYEETEKPSSALEFIRDQLENALSGEVDAKKLKAENERLKQENEELKAKLAKFEK